MKIKIILFICLYIFLSTLISFASSLEEGETLLKEGKELYNKGEYDKALEKLQKSLIIFEEEKYEKGISDVKTTIGNIYCDIGEYNQALKYYNEALDIDRKIKDRTSEADNLTNTGIIYYLLKDNSKALSYYEEGLDISRKEDYKKGQINNLNLMGLIYTSFEEKKEAADCYKEGLHIAEEPEFIRERSIILYNLGNLCYSSGDYEKSLEYYKKSLILKIEINSLSGEIDISGKIADIYYYLGDYRNALEYYKKLLDVCKNTEDTDGQADALNSIGIIYNNFGDYNKSLSCYREALLLYEKTNNLYGKGDILTNIGVVYKNLSKYKEALDYYNQALSIRKDLADKAGEADILGNMAVVYSITGDYIKPLMYHYRCLEIYRDTGDTYNETLTLENIASFYYSSGYTAKALEYNDKSINMAVKYGYLIEEANIMVTRGNILSEQCAYSRAIYYYKKALDIVRKNGDMAMEALLFANTGNCYYNTGEYDRALYYYSHAVPLYIKLNNLRGQADILSKLGLVYKTFGDYNKSLDYYNKALEIDREIGAPEDEAINLTNIGTIYNELNDYEKSLDYYNKAVNIRKNLGIEWNIERGNIGLIYIQQKKFDDAYKIFKENNHKMFLGIYYLALKDYKKAREQFESSVEFEGVVSPESSIVEYTGLGLAEEGLGNYDDAEKCYLKSIEYLENIIDIIPQGEKKNFFEGKFFTFKRLEPYEGLVRVYHKLNREKDSFFYSECTKGRILSEKLVEGYNMTYKLPVNIITEEKELKGRLSSLLHGFFKARENNDVMNMNKFQNEIIILKKEQEKFIGKLLKNYPEYASIKYPRPVETEDIKLKENEVLLEYEVTDRETIIWVIKKGKMLKTISVPVTREDLSFLVETYRNSFEDVKNYSDLGDFKYREGKKLYDFLLREALSYVKDEKIIIVPDEMLGSLPFEALISDMPASFKMKEGNYGPYPEGVKYAGDFYNISYYQSAGAITILRNLNKKISETGFFAMGDPVFNQQDERVSNGSLNNGTDISLVRMDAIKNQGLFSFRRLPQTGELINELKSLFSENIDTFMAFDASESRVKTSDLSKYKYILFATHGILENDVPYIKEPALVLTQLETGYEDGFLTMSEIMNLKLSSYVTVLSACNTGLGKNISGEGISGTGRAFQYGGSQNVVISLWSVDANATGIMMKGYFEYLKEGITSSEALRKAGLSVRKSGYEHPFFWASFISVGE